MTYSRRSLPQMGQDFFLTDGGIETTLIFIEGHDLPYFAAFHLLRTAEGRDALRSYFRAYADLARRYGLGVVLESATWRANPDWGRKLGYSPEELDTANREAIAMLEEIRRETDAPGMPVVISGCIGPRGDGYRSEQVMSAGEAEAYHRTQIDTFAKTTADLVTAITMNYVDEAVGVAQAARSAGIPAVISFTVETDGRLPTGQSLLQAIEAVDDATDSYPAYFMINCAHPSHFEHVLAPGEAWTKRIRGLRANASRMSHAELDEAPELDAGNPAELGRDYARLKQGALRDLVVMGGCCGTDDRHIEAIASACLPLFRQPA